MFNYMFELLNTAFVFHLTKKSLLNEYFFSLDIYFYIYIDLI